MQICMDYIIIGRDGKIIKFFVACLFFIAGCFCNFLFVKYSSENKNQRNV